MSEREETTLEEVIYRIREGTFYDDYDWASGPALRRLDIVAESIEEIASQAVCYGMSADVSELRDWLKSISESAERALEGAE